MADKLRLTQLFKKIMPSSELTTNVMKLVFSTIASGAISFLTLPIITRLFPPEDYGNYQLIYSIVMLFGIVAPLKFELATVLPKREEDSTNLVLISFMATATTSMVFFILFLAFHQSILSFLNAAQLSQFALLIPVGVFVTGILQTCRYLLIRKKIFGELARNKVYQMVTQQGTMIGWGILSPHFIGLFSGYLAGVLAAAAAILYRRLFTWKYFTLAAAKMLIKRYKKFPLINTPSVFLNNLSLYLPVFMFSNFFDETLLGLYTLANQYVVLPINLFGTSIAQVYYQAAAELFNKDPRQLLRIYLQTIKRLSLIGLAPVLAIAVLAPMLAGWVFGESWAQAGVYMQILCFGIYFRFVNMPIGSTFSIIDRQEIALLLIAISVVIRFTAMYLFRSDPISMLWALSISTALFYAVYNYMVYWYIVKEIKRSDNNS